MYSGLYADEDGTATKQSQLQYENHTRYVTIAIEVFAWLGFALSLLSRSDLWKNTFWFLLACHSLTLDMNQGPQTTHMAGIREASLAAFTLIHQLCADDPNATLVAGTCRLFLAFSIVLVSLSIRRKPHLFTRDGRLVDAETTSSILSRCSMAWSRNAILIAGQTSGLEGTPALDHKTRSRSQPPLDLSSSTLLAQIVSQRTPVIAKQWTLTILRTILTFGSPFCVLRLITSFESGHGENKWAWLSGIALFSTCETVVHYHQNWIQWSELGIPIRAQLITSIYAKLLESSLGNITTSLLDQPGHRRSPPVSSLLTSDATTISKFAAIHYILPLSLVQFLMALAFIQKLMGWQGMLITLLVTVLTMPLNDLIVRRRKSTQTELRKTRDQKDRAVNEMIKALHHIKVQGAEEMWKLRIQEYRDQELCAEKRDLQSQIYGSMWKIASPLLVSGISIFANAYLSGEMSASVIFTILELLPQLQGTLGLAPLVVQDYLSAKASARRVESYLSQPDKDNYLQPSRSGDIVFENARFSWPGTSSNRESTPQMTSSGFELSDVNIRVPDRKLTILYGNTGGGKSLMLTAMLGEACLLDGTIEAPCPAQGSQVAYVAQTPWLQSSTIKENILFGRPADPERYSSVLEACDLIQDLDALSNGDETVIGAQGVKVSGGQRARISLARALYSDAKVLIMDDVLSALDTHVAKHVFKALLGPLGAGRTRVLATHQLGLCMPGADYAICVTNGTVQVDVPGSIDTYRALALPSDAAEEKAVMNCDLLAARPDRSKNLHKNHQEKGCSKPKLNYGSMKKELSQTTYSIYVKAIGGRTFAISFLLTLLSRQFLITLPMWKLKNLRLDMQDPVVHESAIASVWYHAGMFVVSSALAVMAEYTFGQVEASGTLRASETLFSTMLDTVVHMPLAWLHDASTGDLLQRFSADSQAMDDRLMPLVSEFSQCFIEMVTIVIVGLNMSRYTGILVLGGLYASWKTGELYNKARKTVQRADRAPTSKILELASSSATGLATIRGLGATTAYMEQMHNHIDDLSKARRYFWIANRWLGLQMSLIGIMFGVGTGALLLLSGSASSSPSLFAFALTFSMRFSSVVFKAINGFGAFETAAIAADAICAFQHLEPEDQGGIEAASD